MSTVTTEPEYGTVEYHADLYRTGSAVWGDVVYCMTGAIRAVIDYERYTDAEKVGYVRNALVAADLVHAEMQAAR